MVDVSGAVLVDLDTHGPTIAVTAPALVTPPSDGLVLFTVSEPVGAVTAYLSDVLDEVQTVGVERVDALSYVVLVPGQGLLGGPARLDLVVDDLVGNRTRQGVDLFVQSDTGLRLDVAARPVLLMQTRSGSSFDLTLEARPSMLLEVRTAGG